MASPIKLKLRTAGLNGGSLGTGSGLSIGGGPVITRESMGMHIGRIAPTTIWGDYSATAAENYHQIPFPDMGIGSVRLWDSDGCSWRNIERSQGVFTWDRLDYAVAQAELHGAKIVITLGCGPDWATTNPGQMPGLYVGYNPWPPSSNAYWTNWCAAVATRYAGKGIAYETWNEVNDQVSGPGVSGSGYIGSAESLVTLSQLARSTISAIDSTAIFLTPNFVNQDGITGGPSITVSLDAYLAAGGGAYADVVSVHVYNTCAPWPHPEGAITMAKRVRDTCAKYGVDLPLWNTEWGYGQWVDSSGAFKSAPGSSPYPYAMPPQMGADYITRMLILSWTGGFERMFFYGLDASHSYATIVMVDPTSDIGAATLQTPALAYKAYADMFVGGRISALRQLVSSGSAYYRASVSSPVHGDGYVYWCDDYKTASVDVSGCRKVVDNLGAVSVAVSTLAVSSSPKFIFF